MEYLGDPALTLVKELKNMDEIWDRLFNTYGNAELLLYKKLGDFAKIGGLDKIGGDEGLMNGIATLTNAMKELSRLAEKYSLEHVLYHPKSGLGLVREIMGSSRYNKFLKKNPDLRLGYQEEWDRMVLVLQKEFRVTQRILISEKSRQLLRSFEPEMPLEEESENISGRAEIYSTSVKDRKNPVCLICGKMTTKVILPPIRVSKKLAIFHVTNL